MKTAALHRSSLFVLMVALGPLVQPVGSNPLPVGKEPLPPPFELTWGEPPANLVAWARRNKFDQHVKEPGGNRRLAILRISAPEGPLPEHQASTLEARFFDGRLYEVTLHYTFPGMKAGDVRGKFTALKELLTNRHGKFVLDANKQATRNGVVTKSMSYKTKPAQERLLLLALTEVRDAVRGDAAAKFSVVYHNDRILRGNQQRAGVGRAQQGFPPAKDPG